MQEIIAKHLLDIGAVDFNQTIHSLGLQEYNLLFIVIID